MNQNNSPALTMGLVIGAGLIAAVWLGSLVGDANYTPLVLLALAAIAALTFGILHRHLLAIGLAIAILDLWAAPGGFKISAMEQSGGIAAAFWLLVFWRKDFNPNAPRAFTQLGSYDAFKFLVIASCGFALIHFLFNMTQPFDELAFGWKGALKAYLQVFGPFLMVVAALDSHLILPVGAKASRMLLKIFTFFFLISFGIKVVYTIRYGAIPETGLDMEAAMEATRTFRIPILNIWDSAYTLRVLGPVATLVGATFLYISKDKRKTLPFVLLILGLCASLISGGRAALIFALFFAVITMFRSGHRATIVASIGVIALGGAIVLMLPADILRKTPWHLQRSIAMVRPDMETSSSDNITGSSDMRMNYFTFAWDYWSSGGVRLLLTGRSVGQMDSADVTSFMTYNEEAKMFFAVRRLATHNGLTDLLLGWGALGYVLILSSWIACLVFLQRYNRRFQVGSYGDCWLFIAKVFFAFYVVYMHIGGSFIWPLNVWIILVAVAQTDGLKTAQAPAPEPVRALPKGLRST